MGLNFFILTIKSLGFNVKVAYSPEELFSTVPKVVLLDIVKNPAKKRKTRTPVNTIIVKIVFHLLPYPFPLFVIRLMLVSPISKLLIS
jgi:hypothetical protein